jgi:pimeloyl-ACP methyl ester carboxylesterase
MASAIEPRLLHFDIPDTTQPNSRHSVACYQWGNPQAEKTVVCVHGLTRNGRDFDYLARALSREYHVLCPDMPGRGHSQWLKNPLGYNNPAYVADVAWILRSLHISKVHWVGTSMGGIMGILAANSMPDVLETLTLNDIGCFIPAEGMNRIRSIADLKTSYKTKAEAEEAYRGRCANFGITNEAHWQHLFSHGLRLHGNGAADFMYDPAIFSVGFPKDVEVTDVDLWPLWNAVTALPVLLIRGNESDILLRRTAVEMESRHSDLLLYEVPNTGHAPTLMENKEIALIHEWISARVETP